MLVDSHCHLDFPDFESELDQIVARAEAAGIGAMLTISTRVRQFERIRALAERFANVCCSVGTHPHYAAEERDIKLEEIVGRAAYRESSGDRRGGPRLFLREKPDHGPGARLPPAYRGGTRNRAAVGHP